MIAMYPSILLFSSFHITGIMKNFIYPYADSINFNAFEIS